MPFSISFSKILIRGRDDPHIDLDQFRPPDPGKLLFLKRSQDLGLSAQTHVADLIQEQRAAVGLLELSPFHGRRAAEGAAFVSEQLALDQGLRNRGTVHRHKGPIHPGAMLMDGPGHQFLARSIFSTDQYATVGRTRGLDQLP